MRLTLLGLSLVLSAPFGHTLRDDNAESIAVQPESSPDQPAGFLDSSTGEFYPADDPAKAIAPSGLTASRCFNYWDGTAPFCRGGPCKTGWHETRQDRSGDGKKCWTGHKVYCECNVAPTCQDYWSGTGPFCKGECTDGYHHELYTSSVGNGGICLTGHKSYCQCNTPGVPPCQPTVIKKTCVGFVLFCNGDCPGSLPFVCGFCWKSRDAIAAQPLDDTLYETLLRDETEKPTIRTALSEIGIDFPPDASNEAVVDSALQVINAQTEQLEAANIDAAASFEQWDDVAAWKKTGTGERVFKGGEEEVVNELVGVGVQAAQAQAAQAQAAQEVKAEA